MKAQPTISASEVMEAIRKAMPKASSDGFTLRQFLEGTEGWGEVRARTFLRKGIEVGVLAPGKIKIQTPWGITTVSGYRLAKK